MKNIWIVIVAVCCLTAASNPASAQAKSKAPAPTDARPRPDAGQVIKDGTWLCTEEPLPPGYEIEKEVDDESCHTGRANIVRRGAGGSSAQATRPYKSARATGPSAKGEEIYASARPVEIVDVAADQKNYIGKYLKITGLLGVSSSYDYGYRQAESTHLAFTLKDSTGTANVYARRAGFAESVREQILHSDNKSLRGTFVIRMNPERYETSADVFADLILAEPAEK